MAPGLWVRRTGGHTAGHQFTYLESDGEKAACFGDIVPTPDHLPLNYVTSFDLYPQQSVEAKQRWLEPAEAENWLLVFGHATTPAAGRLTRNERGRLALIPEGGGLVRVFVDKIPFPPRRGKVRMGVKTRMSHPIRKTEVNP